MICFGLTCVWCFSFPYQLFLDTTSSPAFQVLLRAGCDFFLVIWLLIFSPSNQILMFSLISIFVSYSSLWSIGLLSMVAAETEFWLNEGDVSFLVKLVEAQVWQKPSHRLRANHLHRRLLHGQLVAAPIQCRPRECQLTFLRRLWSLQRSLQPTGQ